MVCCRLVDFFWLEEPVDAICVHEIGPDEPREGERALNGLLRCPGEVQQREGNQRDSDLDPYGVLAGAEDVLDLQGLLDPAEGLSPTRSGNSSIAQRRL